MLHSKGETRETDPCKFHLEGTCEMGHGLPNQKINSDFSYNAPRVTLARDRVTWLFHVLFLQRPFDALG